jgi:hypothetical protein
MSQDQMRRAEFVRTTTTGVMCPLYRRRVEGKTKEAT